MEQFDSITTDISSDKAGASEALNVKYLKAGSAVGPMEGCNLEYGFSNAGARSQIVATTPPGTPTPPGALIGVIGPSSGGNKVEGMNIFMPGSRSALDFSSLGGGNEDETDNGRFSLWVFALGASSPISVTISPADFYGDTDGTTPISGSAGNGREYAPGTEVTMSVPASADGCDFVRWARFDYNTDGSISESTSTDLSQTFKMNSDILFVAGYQLQGAGVDRYLWVRGLRLVSSSPENTFTYFEAPITVSVADISDPPLQDGTGPPFQRLYADGAAFSVTAPATYGGYNFLYWFYDYDFSNPVPGVGQDLTMSADINLYYVYDSTGVLPDDGDNLIPLTFPVFDAATHYFRWMVVWDFAMAIGDNIYDQGVGSQAMGLELDDTGNLIYFDILSTQSGFYRLNPHSRELLWFAPVATRLGASVIAAGDPGFYSGLSYAQNLRSVIFVAPSQKTGNTQVLLGWQYSETGYVFIEQTSHTHIASTAKFDIETGVVSVLSPSGIAGLMDTLYDELDGMTINKRLYSDGYWATVPTGVALGGEMVISPFYSGKGLGAAPEQLINRSILWARDLQTGSVQWYKNMIDYFPPDAEPYGTFRLALLSEGNVVAVKGTTVIKINPYSGAVIASSEIAEAFSGGVTQAPLSDLDNNFFLIASGVAGFVLRKFSGTNLTFTAEYTYIAPYGASAFAGFCITRDYIFVTYIDAFVIPEDPFVSILSKIIRLDHNLENSLIITTQNHGATTPFGSAPNIRLWFDPTGYQREVYAKAFDSVTS